MDQNQNDEEEPDHQKPSRKGKQKVQRPWGRDELGVCTKWLAWLACGE